MRLTHGTCSQSGRQASVFGVPGLAMFGDSFSELGGGNWRSMNFVWAFVLPSLAQGFIS